MGLPQIRRVYPHGRGAASIVLIIHKDLASGVYPHGRGAASLHVFTNGHVSCPGLSPRAWGSQDPVVATNGGGPRVYPHGRGAAWPACQGRDTGLGLSPRAWGSPKQPIWALMSTRSIPTGVGQPRHADSASGNRKVYPHGRGAASILVCPQVQADGLSPRAWGSLQHVVPPAGVIGSIPTGVGQPQPTPSQSIRATVYPHGRGAAGTKPLSMLTLTGLSPRAWGSPPFTLDTLGSMRSIPTGVGQPYYLFCPRRH